MRSSWQSGFPAWLLLAIFSWGVSGCAWAPGGKEWTSFLRPERHAGRQAECRPRFPDQKGWFGGDAAYSVAFGDGRRSLWLFGDSFVARPESPNERSYPFVHNSIAISRCEPGGLWILDPFWRQGPDGEPDAFFEPDAGADWVQRTTAKGGSAYYWPFGGFFAHDALFVGLLRVVSSTPRGPFNLPFRLVGMDLARVENPRDAPSDWRIRISTLSTSAVAFPGSAFALTPSHLYAFAFFDRGDGHAPRMLTRLDLANLLEWRPDLSDRLETWTADDAWAPGFHPERAEILMDDDSTEMSVQFDPVSESWLAVYGIADRDDASPDQVWLRRAAELTGPWSAPEPLFTIPETVPDPEEPPDPNLFCYAGKAHPQFSPADGLLVTYVCNLFARDPAEVAEVLERLRRRSDLYRPRAVTTGIPQP
jgi:hypothetical protein